MIDAEVALSAALAAAEIVQHRFGGPLTHIDKSGLDFATDVDLDAERAILDVLRSNRPFDRIAAEESGRSGNPGSSRCWYVDPLCGTVNFAAGTGPVAVNVALGEGDLITAAAVIDPLTSVAYWTDGITAWRRDGGLDRPLKPSAASRLVDLNLDAAVEVRPGITTLALIADRGFAERFGVRVVSTSLALTWVASGQRAAYITDGDVVDSVHFAAGVGLCRAAGCEVSDLGGAPLSRGAAGLIAAADAQTHDAIVSIIARQEQMQL